MSHFNRARRRRQCLLVSALVSVSALFIAQTSIATDELPASAAHGLELVAPKNRFVLRLEPRVNSYDRQFDAAGNRVANGATFDAVELDSNVLPVLALFGPGATLGTTRSASEVQVERIELTLGYGFTDDFTAGMILPFGRTRNRIAFDVADGNLGFNPDFPATSPVPFAPVGAGISPVGTAGVQSILSNPAFGFGYKPIQTSTREELADPTLGFLWRFHKQPAASATLGFGVRLGITEQNDPDDLADVPLDDGSTDILAQVEYFRALGKQWDLRLLAKRTHQTADKVTMRVPAPGALLAGLDSKEKLTRDPGDYWEYDVEVGRALGNWRVAGTWHRWDKRPDRYRSDRGSDTGPLSANTRILADQWRLSLSWSGISAWRAGKLPMPLIVKLEVQETWRGRNMPDVGDVYLLLTTFF